MFVYEKTQNKLKNNEKVQKKLKFRDFMKKFQKAQLFKMKSLQKTIDKACLNAYNSHVKKLICRVG